MDSTRETGSARVGRAEVRAAEVGGRRTSGGDDRAGGDGADDRAGADGVDADGGARDGRRGATTLRGADGPRFLQLADVAEVLSVSDTQVYALVRSGELRAIKLGGRGRWRVERTELQAYIDRMYDQTRAFIEAHPFTRAEVDAVDG